MGLGSGEAHLARHGIAREDSAEVQQQTVLERNMDLD